MKKYILIIILSLTSLITADAQNRADKLKPQWLRQVPRSMNADVKFVTTDVYAPYGSVSYADEMGRLTVNLPGEWQVSTSLANVQVSDRNISTRRSSGSMRQTGTIETEANGSPVTLNCLRVDEFRKGNRVWALYQVGRGADTQFQDCYVTEKYGATGLFLSLIPGCGQFYKGDTTKGILFLGGCAVGAGASAFVLMQRNNVIKQINQTHDINVIRQLDARQKNMGVAGGICLGATAAIYIWNLIDGALAPGARRVVLTGNGLNYKF